ncbi:MAG TPA: aminotransferase class IV [Spirochaetota bacterium]|nr:aminotransferase class IV [Spirochaetota bacterium]HOM37784.1 aminotransferase class IV [Spirochaetota bacterium]HPQ49339.1 aminotransferase class IV [Spirochaetota bacterium]
MYQFIETIRYENNKIINLDLHQKRVNKVFKVFFPYNTPLNLEKELKKIDKPDNKDRYKIRIVYSNEIIKIDIEKYRIKNIDKIFVIECNNIDYKYKSVDRNIFNELKKDKDEIIIVKNGYLTDTTYTNIVLSDRKKLITPNTPLLEGTKREELLIKGIIIEEEIKLKDLKFFDKIFLINSMLDLGDIVIDKNKIVIQ